MINITTFHDQNLNNIWWTPEQQMIITSTTYDHHPKNTSLTTRHYILKIAKNEQPFNI